MAVGLFHLLTLAAAAGARAVAAIAAIGHLLVSGQFGRGLGVVDHLVGERGCY